MASAGDDILVSYAQAWREALENWPIVDVIENNPNFRTPECLVFNADQHVSDAMRILVNARIRGAPVRDENGWVGTFDLRQTVEYVIESYRLADGILPEHFLAVMPDQEALKCGYLARTRPFPVIPVTSNMLEVTRSLAQGSHIVGIYEGDDPMNIISICSQGKLLKLIRTKIPRDDADGLAPSPSIEQLYDNFVSKPVVVIHRDTTALESFQTMATKHLSGLAVVDDDRRIVHNTSASDIRSWFTLKLPLEDSIEHFLIEVRKASTDERFPYSVLEKSTVVSTIAEKFAATGYHRLWVVDDRVPVGVFSLSDLFKYLA